MPDDFASFVAVMNDAVDAVIEVLADWHDWGPSGQRAGQYAFDLAADDAALAVLRQAGLRVLSEESGVSDGDGPIAVIDPVDGSTNASRGIRFFATSICVLEPDASGAAGAVPVASVVFDHGSGERYEAVRGGGARCNGELLERQRPRPLNSAIVGINGRAPGWGGWAQTRSLGAAALELCAVADGRLDGYIDFSRSGLGSWDYLGALLVCAEAGVEMCDGYSQDLITLDHEARRCPIAAAPPLLDELRAAHKSLTI